MKKTPLKRTNGLKSGGGLSRTSSSLKKGGKIKAKPKTKEQKEAQQEQWEKDKAFYLEIWNERPHYCISCDKYLGEVPNLCFFEHGLPKSTFPQYRYNKENLSLVCISCHQEKEAGFPNEKYKIKLNELRRKHET